MWQERLPRERDEAAPQRALGSLIGELAGKLLLAVGVLGVAAAVVLGSFGYATIAELIGAAIVLALAALAVEPIWRRTRHRASSWWR